MRAKLLSSARRRACLEHVVAKHGMVSMSGHACRVPGQARATQRKKPTRPGDETALTADITALAIQSGRYGFRQITALSLSPRTYVTGSTH